MGRIHINAACYAGWISLVWVMSIPDVHTHGWVRIGASTGHSIRVKLSRVASLVWVMSIPAVHAHGWVRLGASAGLSIWVKLCRVASGLVCSVGEVS